MDTNPAPRSPRPQAGDDHVPAPLEPSEDGAALGRPAAADAPENTASQEELRQAQLDGAQLDGAQLDGAPLDGAPLDRSGGGWTEDDRAGMQAALDEACAARAADEVPIGAVVVLDGVIVGRGRNRSRELRDATAHAEVLALRDAFANTGDMRLPGAVVYSTVEPCFMCAGAIVHARAARVVWAVRDPKFGGAASLGNVLTDPRCNHRAEVAEGLLADEARELLQNFFREKRNDARRSRDG